MISILIIQYFLLLSSHFSSKLFYWRSQVYCQIICRWTFLVDNYDKDQSKEDSFMYLNMVLHSRKRFSKNDSKKNKKKMAEDILIEQFPVKFKWC